MGLILHQRRRGIQQGHCGDFVAQHRLARRINHDRRPLAGDVVDRACERLGVSLVGGDDQQPPRTAAACQLRRCFGQTRAQQGMVARRLGILIQNFLANGRAANRL